MSGTRGKSEAERIDGVANIPDVESCLRYARRAREAGMPALAAVCEERAKTLKPPKSPTARKTTTPRSKSARAPMTTQIVADRALAMLIDDYNAELPPTTYGELAQRCGFEGQQNVRWFGQVTDLIDAACALAGVPSFALIRVREVNGNVNKDAWRREYSHLRERIIRKARDGAWTEEDFTKIRDALALFSAEAFGNKKAWKHVWAQIDMGGWAGAAG